MISARWHLIVRAEIMRPPVDPGIASDWLCRLVAAIGMRLAPVEHNPNAYYCPIVGNSGLTAVALIETSNITLHTWDETSPGELQLDVFTCGDLATDAVIKAIGEFAPVSVDCLILDRRGGLSVAECPEMPDRAALSRES